MFEKSKNRFVGPVALLLALLIVAVGLLACGGGKSAQQIVDDAFSGKKNEIKSGKFDVSLKAQNIKGAKSLPDGNASIKLSGSFDTKGNAEKFPKLDLALNVDAGKTNISAGLITTDNNAFVKYQDTPYQVPAQLYTLFKSSYEQAQQKAQSGKTDSGNGAILDQLGIKPNKWLTNLKKGSDEQIGGTDTYTVSGSVDVSKFANDVGKVMGKFPGGGLSGLGSQLGQGASNNSPAKVEQTIKSIIKSVSFTLNAGKDDGIVRRVKINFAFQVPAQSQKQLKGLESGNIVFDEELANLNQAQTIEEPADAKPLQDLLQKLGLGDQLAGLSAFSGMPGAAGATGGTTTAPSPTTTMPQSGAPSHSPSMTPSGGSSTSSKAYLQCVQAAKGPEDIQKCVQKLQK